MARFGFDDTVRIKATAPSPLRAGALASVIMVFPENERESEYLKSFQPGTVYSVEYEDGESADVHESDLELIKKRDPPIR